MLVGPPIRPRLPGPPDDTADLKEVIRYLQQLDAVIAQGFHQVVGGTIGLLGIRGISSTSTAAHNLARGTLSVGNLTQVTWTFTNWELNTSYLILAQPSSVPSLFLSGITKNTTTVVFNLSQPAPSGMLFDIALLR